jgi:Spy/CpxP family protein refolding chaperone
MTGRWLSEHRRLLAATIGSALLLAVALVALGGGSSAAQRSRRPPPAAAALVATRGQLVGDQAQVTQLQTLTSRQSAEISSLRAQLQALRHPQPHSHRHRRR